MDNLAEEEKGESMPPKEEEEEYDADEVFEAKKWKNENVVQFFSLFMPLNE